jgi:hypothetical protein
MPTWSQPAEERRGGVQQGCPQQQQPGLQHHSLPGVSTTPGASSSSKGHRVVTLPPVPSIIRAWEGEGTGLEVAGGAAGVEGLEGAATSRAGVEGLGKVATHGVGVAVSLTNSKDHLGRWNTYHHLIHHPETTLSSSSNRAWTVTHL